MTVLLDYKPTRNEGKGFLRNLNIRIHRDITGEMGVGVMKTEMLIFISQRGKSAALLFESYLLADNVYKALHQHPVLL